MNSLSIPGDGVEPQVDLVVIRGALWLFIGSECRPLTATQTASIAALATSVAEALADAT